MSVNQLSGHGTLLAYQPTPGAAFSTIAEMGDITVPGLSRNEFDATTQQENIDSVVLGVLRRGKMTVALNWIPDNSTHDHLTGVLKLQISNVITGWRVLFTQVTPNLAWIMSGAVQSFDVSAPVDGKLAATLGLRFSGPMSIGGVAIS